MNSAYKGKPVTSFTPDQGHLTFKVEIGEGAELSSPVIGWAVVEAAVEPIILVNGQVITTTADYVEELNAQLPPGETVKVRFEDAQVRGPFPDPAGPRNPRSEGMRA